MTAEDAIRILRSFQEPEAWEPQITKEAFDALEMAVNALEKEQQEIIMCKGCCFSKRRKRGKDGSEKGDH